jgi:sugar transferase (PEP-CTERM/EpsH1 system associated)
MKIALFTPYLPYPPDTGGKIRSYYLLRALAARFDVDLFTPYCGESPSQDDVKTLEEYCNRVILLPVETRKWLGHRLWRAIDPLPRTVHHFHTQSSLQLARRRLETGAYDVILADEICMTPYTELAIDMPKLIMRQKIDSAHYQQVAQARPPGLERLLDLLEGKQLTRYEATKIPQFQAYLACSEDDARRLKLDAPDLPGLVMPNGADLSQFTPSEKPKSEQPLLLYVGTMSYYPNFDAVKHYFKDIHPGIRQHRPDVHVCIVGHNPPAEVQRLADLPGVTVTGTVADVRPYYQEATVLIVPLRLGGGTRLKIIEAMAMGLPVVSTTVGAEGLDITHGENIFIADDTDSFRASILELLADAELRARIAEAGQQVAHRYDWMELSKPFIDLIESVVERWRQETQ